MKRALLFFFLLVFSGLMAQAPGSNVKHPVKWKSKIEKKSADQYLLTFDAVIEDGWHVYSQFTDEMGSLPMIVELYNQKGNFQPLGKTTETKPEQKFSDVFGVTESFWHHKFQLKQLVKITNPALEIVQVKIDYQVCQESCIQEINNFEFNLKTLAAKEVVKFSKVTTAALPASTEVTPAGTSATGDSLQPADTAKAVTAKDITKAIAKNVTVPLKEKEEPKDPWTIFIGTLLAGILVTFTPCVFPMIPMTVSFFLKQNTANPARGRFNAIFYGICIVVIYVLISVPFHIFEGIDKNIFADISTNVYLNLFFFAVFVTFAISFFGAFEITIPNSLASKADNASNSGGLKGIFFMALTLIIVSFSCTGPVLGGVFGGVLSSDGGAMLLSIGFTGFGLGLALPFMMFALFPNLMGNLPKSGGWLNTVKVVFGFIELALAFKFLSNADLVEQWHLVTREVFLTIWIGVFLAMALYLFGVFQTPHDSPVPFISVGRMLLGILTLCFTIYLIPGLWGAPLKIISGFPPPLNYSESPYGFGSSGSAPAEVSSSGELPEGAHYIVHKIAAFHDYDKGLAYAKEVNKPILIDFTGNVCTNCRLMEDNVWSDPAILSILKNDVVLVSLICDSREKLPENEIFESKEGREITTVGEKWGNFEIERYATNARPYYVMLGPDENQLNKPVGYTPDIEEYRTWLQSGLANFKK